MPAAVAAQRALALLVLVACLPEPTPALLSAAPLQRLCYASSLSYLGIDKIPGKEYASLSRLRPVVQLEEPATRSGVTVFEGADGEGDDVLVCAFRGSANLQNFATNLRLSLVPLDGHPSAQVHAGFQEAARGLWALLEPELERLDAAGCTRRAVFTGHSLGGATAQLCALAAGEARVSELVTFAGPLIGDAAFARHVDEEALCQVPVTHVVHTADPILQNNGPLWAQLGFKQTGREVVCDPYTPELYTDPSSAPAGYAWNMIDHCKYLGIFVGPRLG